MGRTHNAKAPTAKAEQLPKEFTSCAIKNVLISYPYYICTVKLKGASVESSATIMFSRQVRCAPMGWDVPGTMSYF